MQRFQNILFVSHGVKDKTESLQHALKLTSKNEAQLRILITCPPFPDKLSEYKTSYEESLIDKMNKAIQLAKSELGFSKKKIPIDIEVDCGTTPDIRIVRHVLKNSHVLSLRELIKRSQIPEKYPIEHLEGKPEERIPSIFTYKKIDILVMGTLARTGILGFIIGNTAENILHKIDCSLLALKPIGFVLPVKTYK